MVHIDGYNQLDYLTGKSNKSARPEFFYFSDDGDCSRIVTSAQVPLHGATRDGHASLAHAADVAPRGPS
jgi:hypothetical protein